MQKLFIMLNMTCNERVRPLSLRDRQFLMLSLCVSFGFYLLEPQGQVD